MVLIAVAACGAARFVNEFVWDDLYLIVEADTIHDWRNIPSFFFHNTLDAYCEDATAAADQSPVKHFRPVPLISFVWDAALSGREPWAYHLTNALGHLVCVVLVFFLARRLLQPQRRHLAAFAAAWFGLQPHLAEAHVWISGRFDIFCAIFGLSALLLWRRALEAASWKRMLMLAASAALFLAGLLSKEVLLLTLPALVFWPTETGRASPAFRQRVLRVAPFVAVSAVYLAMRVSALSGMRTHDDSAQVMKALAYLPVLLVDAFQELVIPLRVYTRSMTDDYFAWGMPAFVLCLIAALSITIVVLRVRRRLPLLAWGALWFAATLAPVSVIATMLWPGFSRYLFLPSIGLIIGLTDAIGRLVERATRSRSRMRSIVACALVAYLGLLGALLVQQTRSFHDEETLYQSIIDAAPHRAHGYGLLGMTYREHGRFAKAAQVLMEADRRSPRHSRYLLEAGYAYLELDDRQHSLNCAATGIERYEINGVFHDLAARNLHTERPDLAANHILSCLEQEPENPRCRDTYKFLTTVHPLREDYLAFFLRHGQTPAQRSSSDVYPFKP